MPEHLRPQDKYGATNIGPVDVMSSAMYPKVFEEYMDFTLRYSQLVEKLPTRAFFAPMDEDEEVEVELAKGVTAIIKVLPRLVFFGLLAG